MAAPQFQAFNYGGAATVNLPNAVETVLATTQKVSSSYFGCTFGLLFVVGLTYGAAATGCIFRIREQSLTGTTVAGFPVTYAGVAAVTENYVIAGTDQLNADVASFVWVLTASVQGGAAAGTGVNVFSSVTIAQ